MAANNRYTHPNISTVKDGGYIRITKEMNYRIRIIVITVLVLSINLSGQSSTSEPVGYPGGISLQYGMGSYALKDNYISPERYDGLLPYFALGWTRTHEKYVYKLSFAFRQGDDITNYNVSTQILSFRLSQGFLYPLKPVKLFKRDLGLWIGPSTDIFYYDNNPNIAVSGFDYTNSYATLFSLGFRGDAIYPIAEKLSVESSLQSTILSLGTRSVDSEEGDQSGTKPLTLASGLHASFDLGIYLDLFHWLSMGLTYKFEITRITEWENILSSTNSAIIDLRIKF